MWARKTIYVVFSGTTVYSTVAQTDSPANQSDTEKQKACYYKALHQCPLIKKQRTCSFPHTYTLQRWHLITLTCSRMLETNWSWNIWLGIHPVTQRRSTLLCDASPEADSTGHLYTNSGTVRLRWTAPQPYLPRNTTQFQQPSSQLNWLLVKTQGHVFIAYSNIMTLINSLWNPSNNDLDLIQKFNCWFG